METNKELLQQITQERWLINTTDKWCDKVKGIAITSEKTDTLIAEVSLKWPMKEYEANVQIIRQAPELLKENIELKEQLEKLKDGINDIKGYLSDEQYLSRIPLDMLYKILEKTLSKVNELSNLTSHE